MGEEADMERFKDNENGYIQWHNNNSNGFVLNHFGGNIDNVVHKSGCRFLWRKKDDGVRTTYEKICSSDLRVLEQEVNHLRESSWKYCSICFG